MKTRAARRTASPFELSILMRDSVDDGTVEYAKEKILHAARAAPRRVLFGRLKLGLEPHRSVTRPAIAEVMLDLDGRAARAHVAAGDLHEASDLLEQRLRRKLKDIEHESEFLRRFTGEVEPDEWRAGISPLIARRTFHAPPGNGRSSGERRSPPGTSRPPEAAFEMEMLDHDFYPFLDATTGRDAVINRLPDDGYELMCERPAEAHGADRISVSPAEPATMHLAEAVQRLNDGGESFVFYIDAVTGRGNVLYLRYDGHYGVIAPAEPTAENRTQRG